MISTFLSICKGFFTKNGANLMSYFYCTGSWKSTLKNYSCGGTVAHAIDINQKCLDAFLEIFKYAKKHII